MNLIVIPTQAVVGALVQRHLAEKRSPIRTQEIVKMNAAGALRFSEIRKEFWWPVAKALRADLGPPAGRG